MPAVVIAVLFVFAGIIRFIETVPNPGYAKRLDALEVEVVAAAAGDESRALQLRMRCGTEIVDTFTLTQGDFAEGPTLTRSLQTSDAGECLLGARALPSSSDFIEAPIGDCRVVQSPSLDVVCQAKGTTPSSQ